MAVSAHKRTSDDLETGNDLPRPILKKPRSSGKSTKSSKKEKSARKKAKLESDDAGSPAQVDGAADDSPAIGNNGESQDESSAGEGAVQPGTPQEDVSGKQDLSKQDRLKRKREIRDARRANKPQTEEQAAGIDPALHQTPYLAYLDTFHNNKQSWKFNKALQSTLLKHILDTAKIPPSYNPALCAYIAGLQGEAATQRLLDAAKDHLSQNPGPDGSTLDMESEQGRNSALKVAAELDSVQVNGLMREMDDKNTKSAYFLPGSAGSDSHAAESWKRACLVYAAAHELYSRTAMKRVGQTGPAPPKITRVGAKEVPRTKNGAGTAGTAAESNKVNKKRSRGRKRRTNAEDVEISSSDSDDE